MSRRKRKKVASKVPQALAITLVAIVVGYISHDSLSSFFPTFRVTPKNTGNNVQFKTPKSSQPPSLPQKPTTSKANTLKGFHTYKQRILPILENYCYDCHMDGADKGNLDLDKYHDLKSMISDRKAWKNIQEHINWKLMPPLKKEQPTFLERNQVTQWINDNLFTVDTENPDPGPLSGRRLNRIEYTNTVNHLFFIKRNLDSILPPDDSGAGFDNHAANLTISSTHVEKYLLAAEAVMNEAFPLSPSKGKSHSFKSKKIIGKGSHLDDAFMLYSNSIARLKLNNINNGSYHLHVTAGQHKMGKENAIVEVFHNREKIHTLNLSAIYPNSKTYTIKNLKINSEDELSFHFINDAYDSTNKLDRNALINTLALEAITSPGLSKETLFTKKYAIKKTVEESETDFAQRVLQAFAPAAFRRDVNVSEITPYLKFLDVAKNNNDTSLHGIRLAMQAMLLSPNFLFIDSPRRHKNYANYATPNKKIISEEALASRLSYFLWSSPPDQRLLQLATSGNLRANLTTEVNRMLISPKATALIENFAGQWLQLRDLEHKRPDATTYKNFSNADHQDLRKETDLMLRHILLGNAPITDLLNGNYTFLNENLANYYGIKDVKGNHFRKHIFSDPRRKGILTHGSILMLTSTPTRTSPVMRGKYILENILDTSPPPPPPDIEELESNKDHTQGLSLRKELEKHREKSACAACHKMMDPIGFAFENYDATGKWRDLSENDTKGELFTGEKFKNLAELQEILAKKKLDEFTNCVSRKLLTYALARELEYFDKPAIDTISTQLKTKEYKFHTAIQALVKTPAFQYYRSTK